MKCRPQNREKSALNPVHDELPLLLLGDLVHYGRESLDEGAHLAQSEWQRGVDRRPRVIVDLVQANEGVDEDVAWRKTQEGQLSRPTQPRGGLLIRLRHP